MTSQFSVISDVRSKPSCCGMAEKSVSGNALITVHFAVILITHRNGWLFLCVRLLNAIKAVVTAVPLTDFSAPAFPQLDAGHAFLRALKITVRNNYHKISR